MKQPPITRKRSTGYTLIEVLIAVAILAVGLLGMAGIQLKGMRGTQNSFLRTEAVTLANSMAERMLANPGGFKDNIYVGLNTSAVDCSTPPKHCSAHWGGGAAEICDAKEMAQYDEYTWACGVPASGGAKGGVKDLLPNGKGLVTCYDSDTTDTDPCTVGSPLVISIEWADVTPDTAELVTRKITLNTAKPFPLR